MGWISPQKQSIIHKIRWHWRDRVLHMRSDGTAGVQDYIFFPGNGNFDHHLWKGFLYTWKSSAFNRVQFVSYTMLFMILRIHWHDIVLSTHYQTEDRSAIQRTGSMRAYSVLLLSPKYCMNILLRVFTTEVRWESDFKLTILTEFTQN